MVQDNPPVLDLHFFRRGRPAVLSTMLVPPLVLQEPVCKRGGRRRGTSFP